MPGEWAHRLSVNGFGRRLSTHVDKPHPIQVLGPWGLPKTLETAHDLYASLRQAFNGAAGADFPLNWGTSFIKTRIVHFLTCTDGRVALPDTDIAGSLAAQIAVRIRIQDPPGRWFAVTDVARAQ